MDKHTITHELTKFRKRNDQFMFLFVCHSKTEQDICLEPSVYTKLNPFLTINDRVPSLQSNGASATSHHSPDIWCFLVCFVVETSGNGKQF